jgi:hypothetical protein
MDAVVLARQAYNRFVLDLGLSSEAEPWIPPAYRDIPLADGTTRTVYRLQGTRAFGFLEAQRVQTNPFLLDSDGDGMADSWEFAHGAPLADPETLGDCVTAPQPNPVRSDGALDPDGDGLTNLGEFEKVATPSVPTRTLEGSKTARRDRLAPSHRPILATTRPSSATVGSIRTATASPIRAS